VEVHEIQAGDEAALAEFTAVWHASDQADFPDLGSFGLNDFRAFAAHEGAFKRFHLLAAGPPGGATAGVALLEVPLLDNRHSAEVVWVAVHPERRRRGAGRALVETMAELGRADGRRVLNSVVDVPPGTNTTHPSSGFATAMGFEPTLGGNKRVLRVPLDPQQVDALRVFAAGVAGADRYRTLTFRTPWPEEYTEDHCELGRRMSTDEPAGDDDHEEEMWDAQRIREGDALLAAQRSTKLAAVAQHNESGRLVAFTELLLSPDRPGEAWQMATLVHPEHRGHRLGLSVKLANLEFLATAEPSIHQVVTGNAGVNAPMIAINEMLGFQVVSEGWFWQKHLSAGARR
jgi:GNAT superfamily N-acetyltransferase